MRLILCAIATLALAATACGDGGPGAPTATESLRPSPSPTATKARSPTPISSPYPTRLLTPAPTPTPYPTAVPGPPLNVDSETRVVFIRSPVNSYTRQGELWIAALNGNTQRLTPEGENGSFVGLWGDPFSGPATVYYIADASDESAIMYRRKLPDGNPERIAHIRPWSADRATGTLSRDGRYIAYTDRFGIELLDLQDHSFRLIAAGGDKEKCEGTTAGGSIGDCKGFVSVEWSPDGQLIAAREYFWEGGASFIVDPFDHSTPIEAGNCCGAAWSPGSDAICSFGEYGGYSGLYVSHAPDWKKKVFFQEYLTQLNPPYKNIIGCDWIDASTVAVAIMADPGYPAEPFSHVASFDLTTLAVTSLGDDSSHEQCCYRILISSPEDGLILTQYAQKAPVNPNVTHLTQTEALDVRTGARYSFLQGSDMIVAVR